MSPPTDLHLYPLECSLKTILLQEQKKIVLRTKTIGFVNIVSFEKW